MITADTANFVLIFPPLLANASPTSRAPMTALAAALGLRFPGGNSGPAPLSSNCCRDALDRQEHGGRQRLDDLAYRPVRPLGGDLRHHVLVGDHFPELAFERKV